MLPMLAKLFESTSADEPSVNCNALEASHEVVDQSIDQLGREDTEEKEQEEDWWMIGAWFSDREKEMERFVRNEKR